MSIEPPRTRITGCLRLATQALGSSRMVAGLLNRTGDQPERIVARPRRSAPLPGGSQGVREVGEHESPEHELHSHPLSQSVEHLPLFDEIELHRQLKAFHRLDRPPIRDGTVRPRREALRFVSLRVIPRRRGLA
jgi:hypothetical protein